MNQLKTTKISNQDMKVSPGRLSEINKITYRLNTLGQTN